MKTALIGYDDGTKSYLGRSVTPKKEGGDELAKAIVRKWDRMKVERQKTEALRWEACAYVRHRTKEFSNENSPIKPVKLYNTAGISAFDVFINGYHGNLISPSLRWFKLTFRGDDYKNADQIYGANDYLELCEKIMHSEMEKSTFYPMDKLATRDAAVQGTSAEWIIDDVTHGICVYDVIPPWDFWIEKSHNGRVNTLFYQYKLTAQQALERFGEDTIPEEIRRDIESDNADAEHLFLLAIYPRKGLFDRKGNSIVSTGKRFAAVTYCQTSDSTIDESGYDEFPVAVHIWEPDGTSVYGMGLVMRYITELKRLNAMAKDELIAIQKVSNPAMIVPVNMKGNFSTDPGARNYTNSKENRPEIMHSIQDVGWLSNEIKELEEKIRRLFFNDLFNYLMRQDKVLTATQVQAIKSEELSLLASILGTTQYMKINPIVKRTFKIMSRAGRLPKPPKELLRLKNPLLRIELDGPLAKSIKSFSTQNGLQAGWEWIRELKNYGFEAPLDNLDMDDFVRKAMHSVGVPQTVIKELQDVAQDRARKEQIIQQQMAMQQAQQASEIQRNLGGQSNLNNPQGAN
jgi:hypothetical protein